MFDSDGGTFLRTILYFKLFNVDISAKEIFAMFVRMINNFFSLKIFHTIAYYGFRSDNTIRFRDLKDLKKILCTHLVAPHEPGSLCTATPSTLMYVDYLTYPQVIHQLDLSDAHPKPTFGKSVIHWELDREPGLFRDLCFVEDGDKELLAVVDEVNRVFIYNTETGKLEWKVNVAAPRMKYGMCPVGVTTDGHLYISDWKNQCIHMFSLSDGLYMGCLFKAQI